MTNQTISPSTTAVSCRLCCCRSSQAHLCRDLLGLLYQRCAATGWSPRFPEPVRAQASGPCSGRHCGRLVASALVNLCRGRWAALFCFFRRRLVALYRRIRFVAMCFFLVYTTKHQLLVRICRDMCFPVYTTEHQLLVLCRSFNTGDSLFWVFILTATYYCWASFQSTSEGPFPTGSHCVASNRIYTHPRSSRNEAAPL